MFNKNPMVRQAVQVGHAPGVNLAAGVVAVDRRAFFVA